MLNIELGGGDKPIYHPNFDIIESPQVDKVCDLPKGLPLSDNEATHFSSRDFV